MDAKHFRRALIAVVAEEWRDPKPVPILNLGAYKAALRQQRALMLRNRKIKGAPR